jgi:hypothetical protein
MVLGKSQMDILSGKYFLFLQEVQLIVVVTLEGDLEP